MLDGRLFWVKFLLALWGARHAASIPLDQNRPHDQPENRAPVIAPARAYASPMLLQAIPKPGTGTSLQGMCRRARFADLSRWWWGLHLAPGKSRPRASAMTLGRNKGAICAPSNLPSNMPNRP